MNIMKKEIYFLGILLLLLSGCGSTKTLTLEQQAKKQAIEEKLVTNDYKINFNQVVPSRMESRHLTSGYTLTVKNDIVYSFLPYFGGASHVPFNPNEGGIKFQEPYSDYSMRPTRKGDGYEIRMNVKMSEYQYSLFLTVFDNGSAALSITSPQRDSISYYGEIEE